MTPRLIRSLICGVCVIVVAGESSVRADCVVDLDYFDASVRVQVNSVWHDLDYGARIPFPDDGDGKWHKLDDDGEPCTTAKKNCDGDSFDYWVVNVDDGWSVEITVDSECVTVRVADVDAYWDEYYIASSYSQVSPVDFSMNCHGYAFPEGAGTHPDDGELGADVLLNDLTCYSWEYIYNADVTMLTGHNHSMRVEGFFPCTNPYNNWEIYTKTSEKFRESGVYEQTGSCGDVADEHSADPTAAHGGTVEDWRRL